MVRALRRHYRLWVIGMMLVDLLLIAAGCGESPPEILGFSPPAPNVSPGGKIELQVNVATNGQRIRDYQWYAEAGTIIGNNRPIITYQGPEKTGVYKVFVQLQYEGGTPVEGSTAVEVMPRVDYQIAAMGEIGKEMAAKIATAVVNTSAMAAEIAATPIDATTVGETAESAANILDSTVVGIAGETALVVPVPTATPVSEAVVVSASGLNLRFGPGTDYNPPLGFLEQGDILDVQGRTAGNQWIQVVPANSDILGWVSAAPDLVQINVDLNEIPLAQAPPPPTTPQVLLPPPIPLPAITSCPVCPGGCYRRPERLPIGVFTQQQNIGRRIVICHGRPCPRLPRLPF